ncbi:ATP adenylyltransferase [Synechococcus sp. M16CYN]
MGSDRLLEKALVVTERALRCEALVPLQTTLKMLLGNDDTMFELRHLPGATPKHLRVAGPKPNPFRPWDQRLEVEQIGPDHVLILNKFPVQIGHMLLITRQWASQSGWLNKNDWSALASVDRDTTGLWFFNSGPNAGASQPHRHFQLLPRSEGESNCPREHWFLNFNRDNARICFGPLRQAVRVQNLEEPIEDNLLCKTYLKLCEDLNLGSPDRDECPTAAYNLLLTRSWMAVIRRGREGVHGFSVNALGFAGCLLSTQSADLTWLNESGPDALLRAVILPKD